MKDAFRDIVCRYRNKAAAAAVFLIIFAAVNIFSGCAYIQKLQRYDDLEAENANLRYELGSLKEEKVTELKQVYAEKEKELTELERAKEELEESLKKEIGDYQAKLQMTERGLVITFISEIFFDSGKGNVKPNGKITLKKVAEVLNRDVPDSQVAVEGHTDDDPIKHSGWRSNWELSSARSLAVVHFLTDECNVPPERLSANGYGEYHPVAPNDTPQNKQKNRRVEIVILPSAMSKMKAR